MTLLLVEGETVNLFAFSKDPDTLSDGTTTTHPTDQAQVIWRASGDATVNPERTDTGKATTFTPPPIPAGMDSISVTVTAQADDDSTENPGGPLDGHPGNRNDVPGTSVTITVKVIKSAPTTIRIVRQIALTQYAEFWARSYPGTKTAGFLTSQLEVSGGMPPDPPKNWNGLFVREDVRLHPTDPGTARDADFDGVTVAEIMSAGSDGFVVGVPGNPGPLFGPFIGSMPAADNTFWDMFYAASPKLDFKEGPDKTVRGQQTYSCKTGALTPKFVLTRTFHNASIPYKEMGKEEGNDSRFQKWYWRFGRE